MATSIIRITPITNIVQGKVVNNDLIEVREFDAYLDRVHLYDFIRNKDRYTCLIHASVYDDLIIFDEESKEIKYKILSMLTKSKSES